MLKRMTFRLLQYNVRSFLNKDNSSNIDQIKSMLLKLKPDVICLNEVNISKEYHALDELAGCLGNYSVNFFGHAFRNQYGNAILSRFNVVKQEHIHLNGGTVIHLPGKANETKQIKRGLLICHLQITPHVVIQVASTHLDHMQHKERTIQMNHVLQEIASGGAKLPCILVGDLNALSRNDYSDMEWSSRHDLHDENGWSSPSDCSEQPKCLWLLKENGFCDAASMLKHKDLTSEWTAPADNPSIRIDYVFCDQKLLNSTASVKDFKVVKDAEMSDHLPVVVDFELKLNKL